MEDIETLECRIQTSTKDFKPAQVLELDCADCPGTSLVGLLDRFKNLEIVNLANVGLTSLKGFPNLPHLCELDLSGNQIEGGLELMEGCQKLFVLKLSNNKINDLETLKPLAKLELIRELDLSNCEVCKVENYREKVFDLMKSLIYLDGFDKENRPVENSEYYKTENGEDEEDDEDSDDEEEEDDDEGEDEVGLSYLQKSDLGDDDSKDYEAPEGADDDDDDDDESEDDDLDEDEVKEVVSEGSECGAGTELRRGRKRKQENSDEESNQD